MQLRFEVQNFEDVAHSPISFSNLESPNHFILCKDSRCFVNEGAGGGMF